MSTYAKDIPDILQSLREETEQEPPFPGGEPEKTVYVYPTAEGGLYFTPTPLDEEREEPEPQQPEDTGTPGLNTQSNTIAYVTVVFYLFLVLSCLFLQLSMIVNAPEATIYLFLHTQSITTTGTMKAPARALPPLTIMQSTTTLATGHRHQDATQAQGSITFYNGLSTQQAIAAGAILTGVDGVQIITGQLASIPPASNTTPPAFGHVTVPARALNTGAQGNISAYDINGSCCAPSVLVKNTATFTGGQNRRDYTVVTRKDILNAASPLKATLSRSEQAALTAQITAGESLIPPLCSEKITADHRIGDEGKDVTVTVSETCTGIAYNAHDVFANATRIETSEATHRLGTSYSLTGDMQASVLHATITDHAHGVATIVVKLDATYVYQLNPGEKRQLVKLVAGKSKQQAQSLLSQEPGIAGTAITMNGSAATLPADPGKIKIVVVYRSA